MLRVKPWMAALALSAFALSACGGSDDGEATPQATTDAAPSASIQVAGTDGLKFEPTALTALAGDVTIELTSGAAVNHNLVIQELGEDVIVAATAGETASATVTLEAGTYTYYCAIPGHQAAGMEGTLTVS